MQPPSHRATAASIAVSVIIPTFNRSADLLRCLRALASQTQTEPECPFEVVLVDDGSTDDTAQIVEEFRRNAPFPLLYLHQRNSGPARARNVAIAHASAPVCVLIGDDIFASRDFVRIHLAHHLAHPALEEVAVGLTRWADDQDGQTVTPFMHWLEGDGRIQFAYPQLLAGVPADWQHFYTSNLSFKTAYLRQHPFHEGFPNAAMEDIELGYRLDQHHGLRMTFLPEALASHRHPTDFLRSCKRSFAAGQAEYVFAELWPERAHRPSASAWKRYAQATLASALFLPVLRHSANLALRLAGPHRFLFPVLLLHSKAGYHEAESRRSTVPA